MKEELLKKDTVIIERRSNVLRLAVTLYQLPHSDDKDTHGTAGGLNLVNGDQQPLKPSVQRCSVCFSGQVGVKLPGQKKRKRGRKRAAALDAREGVIIYKTP